MTQDKKENLIQLGVVKNYKTIVIGASTTGKTELVRYFRENSSYFVSESDEELTKLNNGKYPQDERLKMNILAPKMVQKVLEAENIIFFTNTHYFTIRNLRLARKKGFKIIQLSLNQVEMAKRSDYRKQNEGYEDHTKYFKDMLAYQSRIYNLGLVDKVIDVSGKIEAISKEIQKNL